jgi:predicted HD phosphohydrolase
MLYLAFVIWGYITAGVGVYNPFMFQYIPDSDKLLAVAIGITGIATIVYAITMQYARSNRVDCTIRNIEMMELSKLWLKPEQIAVMQEAASEIERQKERNKLEKEMGERVIVANTKIVGSFIKEHVAEFLPKFSAQEYEILIYLLETLEEFGNIPSVASKYAQDYDKKQFERVGGRKPIPITRDGKTSYEILATVTLLEHSIRVAKLVITELKNRTDTYSVYMPLAILAALGHDIGKIEKTQKHTVNKEVLLKTDHPFVSEMLIREMFPSYKDLPSLLKLVREHHFPIDGKENMIVMQSLKSADQNARRQELSEWFIKNYGEKEEYPDPYSAIIGDGDMLIDEAPEKTKNTRKSKTPKSKTPKEDVASNGETQEAAKETKTSKPKKLGLGETKTPTFIQGGDGDFSSKAFDVETYEQAIFAEIIGTPVAITETKLAFGDELKIWVVPHGGHLLVDFAHISNILTKVISDGIDRQTINKMTRYAINEWKERGVIEQVAEGRSTRKYEYMFEGRRKVAELAPFSIKALSLNAQDLAREAMDHPLFTMIENLKMAKG